jgi:predicted RNA-binding protein Jag
MTDPITIERAELAQYIRNTADQAIQQTLNELGIKRSAYNPYMSQNQAAKLVGRKRLEAAMQSGIVDWKKPDMDKRTGRVYVNRKDVQKLLNNPNL